MSDDCICGHGFDNHRHGPLELEFRRYWHNFKETRLECCTCDCHKYRKDSWWSKFWNGTE